MRILLFGSTGLLGRHLREAFADHEILATSRSGAEGTSRLDVTDRASLADAVHIFRPAVIVNAAAEAHVERCEAEPARTRVINVDAAAAICQVAAEVGAASVIFSSEYVFDGTAGSYDEDDPVAPLNEYGRQKADLEERARAFPCHLVLRTSGLFGWEPRRKNFVCRLVDALRAGRPFIVPADQLITPTYAPSVARATVELLERGQTGTYHAVGPAILARPDFARLIADAFGLDAAPLESRLTHELGLRAVRPARAGLSDTRLRATLGRPLIAPEAALRAMREAEAA